ncbi:MAG: diaminobutyrate--2-oxoglutarate transaminase [Rhodospirillaceae bacterium]|nr:diaminobutyrate--2-oxoglutarate transaminase [Rhodospirillaceae bacterium]
MNYLPAPTATKPDLRIYERMESRVRSYSRCMPRQFAKAMGAWMYDSEGGRYLDFLTGCSTLNYGHNHPVLKQALLDYINADGIAQSLDLHTEAKAAFLEELEATILKPRNMNYKAMFTGPTGTNAVEAALKLARKVTGRQLVIAFTNGFHGMTLGALACTGNSVKRSGAGIPLNHVSHEAFDEYFGPDVNTADLLEHRLSDPSSGLDAPAAILVETVQGEGGLNVASVNWLKQIASLAKKHGALLIIDDIQAGCGRTGPFFSFERAGITPDIITLAKSLSGLGLPLALTLIRPELDQWEPGEHNGTFRGNCHAFISATAALKYFWRTDVFSRGVKRHGQIMENRLLQIAAKYPGRVAVKGCGMMLGLDVGSADIAAAVTRIAFRRGIVIETSGPHDEVVKILAPLTIDDETLHIGLDAVEAAVADAFIETDGIKWNRRKANAH